MGRGLHSGVQERGSTRQLQGVGAGKGYKEVHQHVGVGGPCERKVGTWDVTTHSMGVFSKKHRLNQVIVMEILEQAPYRDSENLPTNHRLSNMVNSNSDSIYSWVY